jgi:hypothetical protein
LHSIKSFHLYYLTEVEEIYLSSNADEYDDAPNLILLICHEDVSDVDLGSVAPQLKPNPDLSYLDMINNGDVYLEKVQTTSERKENGESPDNKKCFMSVLF